MRYYKGFPEEVKIGERAMTLHDVVRYMLSLYCVVYLYELDYDFMMLMYIW